MARFVFVGQEERVGRKSINHKEDMMTIVEAVDKILDAKAPVGFWGQSGCENCEVCEQPQNRWGPYGHVLETCSLPKKAITLCPYCYRKYMHESRKQARLSKGIV